MTQKQADWLIIRHLKRNNPNPALLRRLVAKIWLCNLEDVTDQLVCVVLTNLIERHGLLDKSGRNWRDFFLFAFSFEPEGLDKWGEIIYRASYIIRFANQKEIPDYPSPAYFRNREC